ncbi:MAG: DUF151 domain-containing protein [Desulfobacterales bacterium]
MLQNVSFDRPMTHDLFKTFVDTMDVKLTRIECATLKTNVLCQNILCGKRSRVHSGCPAQ